MNSPVKIDLLFDSDNQCFYLNFDIPLVILVNILP